MKVILASASPRRRELLKRIFPEFELASADIDETAPEGLDIHKVPEFLACEKNNAISKKYPDDLIITADTVVIFNDKILGKPTDRKDAIKMLNILSDNTHKVITGCCIRFKEKVKSFSSESLVKFYKLSENEISNYVSKGLSDGKAGAYGIQDEGSLFVEKIDGDYYNIVGLPIAKLNKEIHLLLDK